VHGDARLHVPQHQHRHADKRLATLEAGKHAFIAPGFGQFFDDGDGPWRQGTRCSFSAFLRSGGTFHTLAPRLNSSNRVPIACLARNRAMVRRGRPAGGRRCKSVTVKE
jgi:hypothetical protein